MKRLLLTAMIAAGLATTAPDTAAGFERPAVAGAGGGTALLFDRDRRVAGAVRRSGGLTLMHERGGRLTGVLRPTPSGLLVYDRVRGEVTALRRTPSGFLHVDSGNRVLGAVRTAAPALETRPRTVVVGDTRRSAAGAGFAGSGAGFDREGAGFVGSGAGFE